MLIINGKECSVISTSLKFGLYKTLNDDFKEVYKENSFPLFILVKFKTEKAQGYFGLDIEDFRERDFQKLEGFQYGGVVSLNKETKFSIFELSIDDRFMDSFDVETKAKVKFFDVSESSLRTTIEVVSEDFNLSYDGELELKIIKGDKK